MVVIPSADVQSVETAPVVPAHRFPRHSVQFDRPPGPPVFDAAAWHAALTASVAPIMAVTTSPVSQALRAVLDALGPLCRMLDQQDARLRAVESDAARTSSQVQSADAATPGLTVIT